MRNSRSLRRSASGFNMTPLIDMVFTLTLFFTLTLHIEREQAAKITLPKADQAAQVKKLPPKSLVVLVAPDGTLVVNGKVESLADFEAEVAGIAPEGLPRELVVRGDGGVRFEVIQGVMRAASRVGIAQVELSASRESEDLR